jgi:hypothetical protein
MSVESLSPVQAFQDAVREALTQGQTASVQVLYAISDTYGTAEEQLQSFLDTRLSELDETAVELLMSPQFTAKEVHRDAFARAFGLAHFTRESLLEVAETLGNEGLKMPLEVHAGLEVLCPLKPVMVERFVLSLGLHKPLHPDMRTAIQQYIPGPLQGLAALYGRRDVFQFESYREVYAQVLSHVAQHGEVESESLLFLTEILASYKPTTLDALRRTLERLIQSCEADMAGAETRSYHHPTVQAEAAGSEHDRHEAEAVRANYMEIIRKSQHLLNVIH